MTDTPDRIFAWPFIADKQDKGGWNDTPDRHETQYLKATPAREAAEDLLEALFDILDSIGFICGGDHELMDYGITMERAAEIRAAIAKARGQS